MRFQSASFRRRDSRGPFLFVTLALWLSGTSFLLAKEKTAGRADSFPATAIRKGTREWGLLAGAGLAHPIWGGVAGRQFVVLGGRFGYVLTDALGPGFLRGNLEIGFEALPAFLMFQEKTAYAVSGTLVLRHILLPRSRLMPFISSGAGALYASDPIPPGVSRFNFTPQIGLGVQFLRRDRMTLALEYRLHHISNAGLGEKNPGINSSYLQIGMSVYH